MFTLVCHACVYVRTLIIYLLIGKYIVLCTYVGHNVGLYHTSTSRISSGEAGKRGSGGRREPNTRHEGRQTLRPFYNVHWGSRHRRSGVSNFRQRSIAVRERGQGRSTFSEYDTMALAYYDCLSCSLSLPCIYVRPMNLSLFILHCAPMWGVLQVFTMLQLRGYRVESSGETGSRTRGCE